jgi:tripartite-type tricarboxylate transporter receptor subunit TctC
VKQKRLFIYSVMALAFATIFGSVAAQTYPAKPIQIYVAFAPGGAGDLVARLVAKKMSESMGQPVIIENRPAPLFAVTAVAKSKPEGYEMILAGSGTALTSSLFKTLPYDLMADFTHVSSLASFDLAMITNEQAGFKSPADVIAYAKANPGKLNIGTVRIGSTQNLTAEMFKSMAGINAVIVPYKSTGDIISAVRSNDVQIAFEILSPILTQVTAKNVKALAVTSGGRFPGLPEVPTLSESGLPGFEASSWNGLSVRAGTPAPIVDRLVKEIDMAIKSSEVQKTLLGMGMVPISSSSEQMTQRIKGDIDKWRGVIDKAGIPRQ